MSGNNPIEANSEVPMANAPSTRANSTANLSRAGLRLGLVALACTSAVISAPLVSELEGTGARCGSELRRPEWPIRCGGTMSPGDRRPAGRGLMIAHEGDEGPKRRGDLPSIRIEQVD